ncbi:MAG: hypothetical protein ACHQUB_03645 [Candidatus Saccharimonadia bacterium]
MPRFGKLVSTKFSKTRSGRARNWLPDLQGALGTRRILTGSDRHHTYRVVFTSYGNRINQHLRGEILWTAVKETHREVRVSTLPKLSRTADEIRDSNDRSVLTGLQDINALVLANENLANWTGLNDLSKSLIRAQVEIMATRLLRARTSRRSHASVRLEAYWDLLDSLGRPNPLIVRGQFEKAARDLADQLSIDVGSLFAILSRISMAASLWIEVATELEILYESLRREESAEMIDDITRELEGLQIKPFSFATSHALWLIQSPQTQLGTLFENIRSGFDAELMLINVEEIFATIKHYPQQLERIDISEFSSSLPLLQLNQPYTILASALVEYFETMRREFSVGRFEVVSAVAQKAQYTIRNRAGRISHEAWNQAPIIDGRVYLA